jgi:hypothetical protein
MIEKIYKDKNSQLSVFINKDNKIVLDINDSKEPNEMCYTGLLELDEEMTIDLIEELKEQLQVLRTYKILDN